MVFQGYSNFFYGVLWVSKAFQEFRRGFRDVPWKLIGIQYGKRSRCVSGGFRSVPWVLTGFRGLPGVFKGFHGIRGIPGNFKMFQEFHRAF